MYTSTSPYILTVTKVYYNMYTKESTEAEAVVQ